MTYINQAYQVVDRVCDAESDAYDGLPDNFQMSAMGEKMEQAVGALEDAKVHLEDAKDALREAQASLLSAIQ